MSHVYFSGHGVAEVLGKKTIGKDVFLNLKVIDSGMLITCLGDTGVRPLMSLLDAKRLARRIKALDHDPKQALQNTGQADKAMRLTWNQRYREYMEVIKAGEPNALMEVFESLLYRREYQELSFGERKMLDCAQSLILREVHTVLESAK